MVIVTIKLNHVKYRNPFCILFCNMLHPYPMQFQTIGRTMIACHGKVSSYR